MWPPMILGRSIEPRSGPPRLQGARKTTPAMRIQCLCATLGYSLVSCSVLPKPTMSKLHVPARTRRRRRGVRHAPRLPPQVINLERGVGFGELALFSDAKRSASVQTAEPTEPMRARAGRLHSSRTHDVILTKLVGSLTFHSHLVPSHFG